MVSFLKNLLPEPMAEKDVLLGVFYQWSAALHTDSPEAAQQAVRAVMPTRLKASVRKQAALPFAVGVVRWSALQERFWWGYGQVPPRLFVVHPSHIGEALRPLVRSEEPPRELLTEGNTVCDPREV